MKIVCPLLLVLVINSILLPQTQEPSCDNTHSNGATVVTHQGGKYMTASGDLKVLVVFAKFKDDTSSHQFWPADSYPSEMNNFIDPDLQKRSTHYLNLTNYYNQMSFGKFRVTGRAIGVETPYPKSHYTYGSAKYPERWVANKAILEVVDDSINYNEFDNWKYIGDYEHSNEPDGIIDMIVVIWRGLVITNRWSGEMSLGNGAEFWVENHQKRILMCYGGNPWSHSSNGSGVNVQYWGERTPERNFKVVVHEIAHWLIQVEHPYQKLSHTFWGMLTLGTEGICVNAFERERLGWLNATPIEGTISSASMSDYITTPSAYKYYPPNGNSGEMYYFENHQQLSLYDNGTSNVNDKGIFILHLANDSYSGNCVRILTSDGFWNWESPYSENCWGIEKSALKKLKVNRDGMGNRDRIFINDTLSAFLYAYIDEDDRVECNDWWHGFGFNNAFDTKFNDVFSNWSNPPAKTWNGQSTDFIMEVINESGSIVTVSFAIQNSVDGKPSKPHLGWDPRKPDYNNGIYLAWGADFWDGNPIESDVNWSELQRKVDSGSWNTIYSGPNRYWSDSTINFNSNETIYYKVRVRDSQNQLSIWSELFEIKIIISDVKPAQDYINEIPSNFKLYQNYPNPFNPSTTIEYQIPELSFVTLQVFDLLGSEIVTLVNENKPIGNYEINFNATQLPSGIYFYRLQAGSFVETKKMMLTK